MQDIIIHPLVTLSIVDHHNRKDGKRVLGILLGSKLDGQTHVTSSYALIFEEDEQSFFIDTSYLKKMYNLYHRVNSKEEIIGWYHTGGRIFQNDFEISQYIQKHTENVYCLIINTEENDFIKIYKYDDEKMVALNFQIEAEEAEEVGVEHLIRDIKDEENGILEGLKKYKQSVDMVIEYLEKAEKDYNFVIMQEIQECLNNLPEVHVGEMKDVYFGNLVKSVVRLKDLVNNRNENRSREGIMS